jgi:hypothetical protein
MALSLPQVEGRLIAMGLGNLLLQLLGDGLTSPVTLPFSRLAEAQSLQRYLYRWLWFNPQVKERVSLRVDEGAMALTLTPKSRPERRGRVGSKRSG